MKKGLLVVFVISILLLLSGYGISGAKNLTKNRSAASAVTVVKIAAVKSPRKGDSWVKNRTYMIQWTKSSRSNARVNISLYDARGKVRKMSIAGRVSDSGSYRWKIPASVRPGSYMVVVESESRQLLAKSAVFSIREATGKTPGKTAAAGMAKTGAGTVVKPGTSRIVKPGPAAISKAGPAGVAAKGGVFPPSSGPAAATRSRMAAMKAVHVKAATVTSPKRGDTWVKTRTYLIRWKKSGKVNARVNVGLYDPRGKARKLAIAGRIPDSGSYRWEIPSSVAPGNYVLGVDSQEMNFSARSAIFSIKDKGKVSLKAEADSRMKAAAVAPSEPESSNQNLPDLTIDTVRFHLSGDSGVVHVKQFARTSVFFQVKNLGGPMGEGRPAKFRYEFDCWTDVNLSSYHDLWFDISSYEGDDSLRFTACEPGSHTLTLTIDSENWIEESNEKNNTVSITFIVDPTPALGLYVNSGINRGLTVNIPVHAYVVNEGDGVSESCQMKFYLKKAGTKTFTVPPLQPGQRFIATRKHRYYSSGFKKIRVEIDEPSLQVETSLFVRLPHHPKPNDQKGYRYSVQNHGCSYDNGTFGYATGYCDEPPSY